MTSVWDDVRYDPASSDEVSRQLAALATALGESLAVMGDEADFVADGWNGAYRRSFDAESSDAATLVAALVEATVGALAAVEVALAMAMTEQAVRVSARHRLIEAGVPSPPAVPAHDAMAGGYR